MARVTPFWDDAEALDAELEKHGRSARAVARANPGVGKTTITKRAKEFGLALASNGAPARPADAAGEEVSDEEILRRRVKDLERRLAAVRDEEVREERLAQRLENAIPFIEPRYRAPVPKLLRAEPEAQEFVLLLSDLHAAETVSLEETEGLNAYDWNVMMERLANVQASVISHKDHAGYPVRTLRVWMLGDMLSGDIHEELSRTNDRPLAEATVDLAHELAIWLEEFVPHFERIIVQGVPGNHPRLSQRPSAKLTHNNADWLCYRMVEMWHRQSPSISFEFKRGAYQVVTLAERWRALLMHGDGIRSGFPGVPWGGVVRRVKQLQAQFYAARKPFDIVAMGHWHEAHALSGIAVDTFINGSVKGIDEYALKLLGQGQPAQQRLLSVHPRRGVTAMYWIGLQESQPAASGWLPNAA